LRLHFEVLFHLNFRLSTPLGAADKYQQGSCILELSILLGWICRSFSTMAALTEAIFCKHISVFGRFPKVGCKVVVWDGSVLGTSNVGWFL
jgi:hypothetical protein